jgi:hypothetical protein
MALLVAVWAPLAAVSARSSASVGNAETPCQPWTVAKAPGPSYDVILSGVSGTSSTDVWAVGFPYFSTPPLILHWDGAAWTEVPPQPRVDAALHAVAAITPADTWAVGTLGGGVSVAEHWDGSAWQKVLTPRPGSSQFVFDVSALSSTDVWAVGDFTDQEGQIHPFTMHWEGERWRFVPAPDAATGANVLYGVSAAAPDDVWAVGYQEVSAYDFQPLIEHWDGTAWSVVEAAPPPTGITNFLYGVEAISVTDAWAVGYYSSQPSVPLIEHWDGTAWTVVDAPPLPGLFNNLYAVSAAAADDVWAVGEHDPLSGGYRPLTLHWDGTAWAEVRAKSPGVSAKFYDVVALSADDVWAVGAFYGSGPARPLTEHSNGCST